MRLHAASTRFAIATLCAYVPGASSERRRSSGRLGSELEQRQIGRDVRDRLGDRQQEEREPGGHQPVQRAPQPAEADFLDGPAAREAQGEGPGQVSRDDDQDRRVEVAPAPQRFYRECGRDAADHAQECRGHVVEDRLQTDHHGQNHRCDHRDSAVEQHRHHHGEERHEDDFRMRGIESRDESRLREQHGEQPADQGHLPLVAVGLASVEDHQHPENRQDQRVAQQRAEHATDRVRRRRAAAQQLLMQRQQALVGFVRDHFMRGHDPVAGAHDVFAGIDAAAQLVAATLGLELLRDQRGPEELAHQFQVEHVAHARAGVRVELLGTVQVLGEREDLVALDRRLGGSAAHDQLAGLLDLQHARPGDALRERAIEQPHEGLLQGAPLPAFAQIRGFLQRDRYAEIAGRANRRLGSLVHRRVHRGKERGHGGGGAVVGVLAKLVDRLR